jgi:hypothetical protein
VGGAVVGEVDWKMEARWWRVGQWLAAVAMRVPESGDEKRSTKASGRGCFQGVVATM